jgi:ribosome-binding factor A
LLDSVRVEGGGKSVPTLGGAWNLAAQNRGRHGLPEQTLEYGAVSERMRRVNESVRQVLAEALPELKDPRIGLITVTGVDTAPDLTHATVYVSVLGSGRKRRSSILGLEAAHGVLQSRLAHELRLKRTPQLTFEYDPTVERGVRMTRLIDELAPDDDDSDL